MSTESPPSAPKPKKPRKPSQYSLCVGEKLKARPSGVTPKDYMKQAAAMCKKKPKATSPHD
jgi:hypothetical protein